MQFLFYLLGKGLNAVVKRVVDWYWQYFLVAFCSVRKEIIVADVNSLRFNGKTYLDIASGSSFRIGANVVINSGQRTSATCMSKIHIASGGEVHLSDNVGISSTSIICKDKIVIGKNVNIGAGCLIIDSNMHSLDWQIRADRIKDNPQKAKKAPIYIKDNVFIGARCIIGKGVTIGEKSIIAAGSVVVKDIPANCIAGGNPCVVIKYLE